MKPKYTPEQFLHAIHEEISNLERQNAGVIPSNVTTGDIARMAIKRLKEEKIEVTQRLRLPEPTHDPYNNSMNQVNETHKKFKNGEFGLFVK